MGQGSHEVYIEHPERSKVFIFSAALRMAETSAWAVGSQCSVTQFEASATTSPSFAITAPNGPPPFFTLSSESLIALIISSLSFIVLLFSLFCDMCVIFR